MSSLGNMFTCPGFVFCPRKPWETGNDYHTIGCGVTFIVFFLEIVEGKDRPRQLPKTIGLFLRMTKDIGIHGGLLCWTLGSVY